MQSLWGPAVSSTTPLLSNFNPLYARHLAPGKGVAVDEDGSALAYKADQSKEVTHDRRVA